MTTFDDFWQTTGPWPDNILTTAFKEVAEKAWRAGKASTLPEPWTKCALCAEQWKEPFEVIVASYHAAHPNLDPMSDPQGTVAGYCTCPGREYEPMCPVHGI